MKQRPGLVGGRESVDNPSIVSIQYGYGAMGEVKRSGTENTRDRGRVIQPWNDASS